MTDTAKKLIWLGTWTLSVLVSFGGGLWAASYFLGNFQTTNFLTSKLAEAMQTQYYLELLDNGDVDRAKQNLNLAMDGHIISLGTMAEHTRLEKDREATKALLHRIAEHRKKHPALYPQLSQSKELDEAKALVSEILENKDNGKK